MKTAQEFCESLKMRFANRIGDRYFRVEFLTSMVPLIYVKYVGAKQDSKLSELVAARSSVHFTIFGFDSEGVTTKEKVTATSPDDKHNNMTDTLEKVEAEISKILEKVM